MVGTGAPVDERRIEPAGVGLDSRLALKIVNVVDGQPLEIARGKPDFENAAEPRLNRAAIIAEGIDLTHACPGDIPASSSFKLPSSSFNYCTGTYH